MAIKKWIKESLGKRHGYIFYFGAVPWLMAFAIAGNLIAWQSGLTNEVSKIFYWGDKGLVAGEFTVRIATTAGPNFSPSFPKVMRQGADFPQTSYDNASYSDGATPQILAKYDAVAFAGGTNLKDESTHRFASEIKSFNSNTVVLGFPGSLLGMVDNAPDAYKSTGSYYAHITNDGIHPWQGGMANYTKAAAGEWVIANSNHTGRYDGLTNADLKDIDGVFYPDGRSAFWEGELCDSPWTDLDFDENGIADTNKDGVAGINGYANTCKEPRNVDNINKRWQTGYSARMQKERSVASTLHSNFKIVVNDGGPPIGDNPDFNPNFKQLVDGFMFENAPDWIDLKNTLIDWDKNGRKPSLVNWVDTINKKRSDWKGNGQNDFQKMRFHLTTTMLGDAYYGLCMGEGNMVCFWYDEFDADLGQPTSEPREISRYCKDPCPEPSWGCAKYCPYVRFFERGAVLVNPIGENIAITNDDIKNLTGYQGPYYRFYGGQDPGVNNGTQFNSVTLKSTYTVDSNGSQIPQSGDGIILVKNPNTYLVSEILVGNGNHDDTSPGSSPVQLTGNWKEEWSARDENGVGNPYYVQFLANWLAADINDGYPMVYTDDKNATATFKPTIGLAGEYEVFEWHGWRGNKADSANEATNVPVEIKHSNGTTQKTLNQRENYGQWNSLGKYNFNQGTDGYVKFSTAGTDGVVLADVIKFVYVAASQSGNNKADFNCDHQVNIYDFGNLMSCWGNAYIPANPYNCASQAVPALCSSPDLTGDNKVDVNDLAALLSCWGKNMCGDSASCGNGICETGETATNCSADCGASGPDCGNHICESGENNSNCAVDCPSSPPPPDCPPIGKEILAKSGSPDDVQTAINSASSGDLVRIPAGRFAYDKGLEIAREGITLAGTGNQDTILYKSADGDFSMLKIKANKVTVKNIQFHSISDPNSRAKDRGIYVGDAVDFRISNCYFEHFSHSGINVYSQVARGVIDHCKFVNIYRPTLLNKGDGGLGYGVAVERANYWEDNVQLGGPDAVFIEDSEFSIWRHAVSSNAGAHYVFRHNYTWNETPDGSKGDDYYIGWQSVDAHGQGYGSGVGTRAYEVYDNLIETKIQGGPNGEGMLIRGGDGVIFNNTIKKNYNSAITLTCEGNPDYNIKDLWLWNNTYDTPEGIISGCDDVREGQEYHLSPKPGYTPYTYPHPLTQCSTPPPPSCSGVCLPSSCANYQSCSALAGTCPSGQFCCQGSCTTTQGQDRWLEVNQTYWGQVAKLTPAWGIDVEHSSCDGTVDGKCLLINKHINPNTYLMSYSLVNRDTTGCSLSAAFGDHQKDWDYLVQYRDDVFAREGLSKSSSNWDKMQAIANDIVHNHRTGSGDYVHPVDTIVHGAFCTGAANALVAVANTLGIPGRTIDIPYTHTVAELYLDGKWSYADNTASVTDSYSPAQSLFHLSFLELLTDPAAARAAGLNEGHISRRSKYNVVGLQYWVNISNDWRFQLYDSNPEIYPRAYQLCSPVGDNLRALYPEISTLKYKSNSSRAEMPLRWDTWNTQIYSYLADPFRVGKGVRMRFYVSSLTGVVKLTSRMVMRGEQSMPSNGGDWHYNINGSKFYLKDYGGWNLTDNDELLFNIPLAAIRENSENILEFRSDTPGSEFFHINSYPDPLQPYLKPLLESSGSTP